jgi:hypothetical protein
MSWVDDSEKDKANLNLRSRKDFFASKRPSTQGHNIICHKPVSWVSVGKNIQY